MRARSTGPRPRRPRGGRTRRRSPLEDIITIIMTEMETAFAIQRGKAASLLGSFPIDSDTDEFLYTSILVLEDRNYKLFS